jgi:hypothetical protein
MSKYCVSGDERLVDERQEVRRHLRDSLMLSYTSTGCWVMCSRRESALVQLAHCFVAMLSLRTPIVSMMPTWFGGGQVVVTEGFIGAKPAHGAPATAVKVRTSAPTLMILTPRAGGVSSTRVYSRAGRSDSSRTSSASYVGTVQQLEKHEGAIDGRSHTNLMSVVCSSE